MISLYFLFRIDANVLVPNTWPVLPSFAQDSPESRSHGSLPETLSETVHKIWTPSKQIKLNPLCSKVGIQICTGVNFINCFTPYAELPRLAPNFCASKKLLQSWAQGAKVGRRSPKPYMKSTPGLLISENIQLTDFIIVRKWWSEYQMFSLVIQILSKNWYKSIWIHKF